MDKDNFNANVDFVRGQADMIVLSALSDNDKYGLEILNAIQDRSQGMYSLKQATLYSSLKRLEKNGYVHAYDGDVSNGAKRVYYGLTEQGREHLNSDKSYWEFCNFLMSNLISDNKFDPVNEEKPFDPAEFRPLTRRNKSASDNEKVVIKYVYLNQDAPLDGAEAVQDADDEKIEGVDQEPEIEIEYTEENSLDATENTENIDQTFESEDYSYSAVIEQAEADNKQEYVRYDENSELSENAEQVQEESQVQEITHLTTALYSDPSNVEDKLAKIAEELAEIKEKIDNNQVIAATVLEDQNEQTGEVDKAEEEIADALEQAEIYNDEKVELKSVEEVELCDEIVETVAGEEYGKAERRVGESSKPSPFYSQRRYFDENNEVNYISSFSDMFNSIEDEPVVEEKEEIDYLTMKEMVYKFHAKGVNVKPYDKKDTMEFYVNRYYYSNKLHMHTSLIIFAILAIELIFSHLICNRNVESVMPAWALILAIIAVGLYPVARYVVYIIDPTKKTPATFNLKSSLLISLLPIITLPIVFALAAFVEFGANIHNYMSMERTIVLPSVLLFNIPLYFVVYALLYRTYKYHIN